MGWSGSRIFAILTVGAFFLGAFFATAVSLQVFSSIKTSSSVPYSSIQSAFCPSPECEMLPISTLNGAKSRVWVAMYSFTNENLANALIEAKQRGVDVRVIVEKQQAGGQYSQHQELFAAGIPVSIDTNPQLMHHKFAVIDSDTIITGSMNWTGNGANENNENELVIHSPELNAKFAVEFQKIWDESMVFFE